MSGQKTKQRIENLKTNKKFMSFFRVSTAIVVLAGVLFLGIGIGNGKIIFGKDALYRQSLQQSDGKLSYDGIDELYTDLKDGYDGKLDTKKLEDGLKEGLVKAAGDPYTEYQSQEKIKSLMTS